jgi:hypothetical protein
VTEIANTSSSLTISWSDPECELRGGYFVRYDVIFSSLSQNYSSVVRFKEVTGLQTYTEYKVQIAYVNTKGAGPLTVQQPFKTGEGGIKMDFFVLLYLHRHLGSPPVFGVVCVTNLISFLCCVELCFCVLCCPSLQYLWIVFSWLRLRIFSSTWGLEQRSWTLRVWCSWSITNYWHLIISNRIDGVMVSLLTVRALYHVFEPRSGQPNNYIIVVCCFSAKHTALRRKKKDRLVGIRLICLSGETCLFEDCFFSDLAL